MSLEQAAAAVFTRGVLPASAVLHTIRPQTYDAMMPAWVPAPRLVNYAAGAAEAATALGAAHPRTRPYACWLGIATMLAVFPAHLDMLRHPENHPRLPLWGLWARLPLQAVFVRLIWVDTR